MMRRRKPRRKYKSIRVNIPFEDYLILNEILANKGYLSISSWVKNIVEKEIRSLKSELQPTGWLKLDIDTLNFIDKLSETFTKHCIKLCKVDKVPFEVLAHDYSEEEKIVSTICKALEEAVSEAVSTYEGGRLITSYHCYPEPHAIPFANLIFYVDDYPYTIIVEGNLMFDEQLRTKISVKGLRISGDLILAYWRKRMFEQLLKNISKWNPKISDETVTLTISGEDLKELEEALIRTFHEYSKLLGSNIINIESHIGVSTVRVKGEYERKNVYYSMIVDGAKEEILPNKYVVTMRLTA